MSATTKVPFVRTSLGLALCIKGRSYNVSADDSIYPDVVAALREGKNETEVLDLIESAVKSFKNATKITNDVSIQDGVVYFKGEQLHMTLATRMVKMLEEGFDLVPMANFLSNLMSNPSRTAVQELYSFLEKGNMPITPDGCFMAYKAVRADYKDIHSGTFDNSVGQICEMPRNQVDDNRDRTCSAGLHFCSFDYLPHFANANGHVMLLKINPRDVVSIPADYNDTKGRCSRYEVVGEYEGYYKNLGPAFSSMLYDPENDDVDDSFDNDEYTYTVYGLDAEDDDVEYADVLSETDSLNEAKNDAVEFSDDYAVVVVMDQFNDEVFRIRSRN